MEQMKIDEGMVVAVDYEAHEHSKVVKELRPVVFKEEGSFCCLLGPDPQAGIFGCGDTAEGAISDWEQHLKERMAKPIGDDEVAQYVQDTLNASNKKVW
jgi:hypothetical protein